MKTLFACFINHMHNANNSEPNIKFLYMAGHLALGISLDQVAKLGFYGFELSFETAKSFISFAD